MSSVGPINLRYLRGFAGVRGVLRILPRCILISFTERLGLSLALKSLSAGRGETVH